MLEHITDLLIRKGYGLLDEDTEGILYRESKDCIWAVTLSFASNEDDTNAYIAIQRKIEFNLSTKFGKKVQCLHIVLAENGMFQGSEQYLIHKLSNVWLIAKDTGRLYVFDKQPVDFDNLRDEMESVLCHCIEHYKKEVAFRFTPVNTLIVIVNALVFVIITIIYGDFFATHDSDNMLAMGAMSYATIMDGAWYQIITSCFLHFGFIHLMNNMILLAYTGCELERKIGSLAYFICYMCSGIVGNLASLWYYHGQGEQVVSAGASGAIYGVIGALFVLLVVRQIKNPELSPTRLLVMIGITIYYGLTSAGVDNAAHIGGLIAGLIGGLLLSKISHYGKLE